MREVVLGNGTMMLNFDKDLSLRDLYWPYGGFENHGDGNRTNFGVFADGRFSWFFSPEWVKSIDYLEDTPITRIIATNYELGLELEINHALHWAEDLFLKKIVVKNLRQDVRDVKLIFYQDLSIKGIEAGDSAVYDPQTGGVYQYKKGCYILANCRSRAGGTDEYSAGVKRYRGHEGTFRDAEDGHLSFSPIADGPVDSAIGIKVVLDSSGEEVVFYWLMAGYGLHDLRSMNQRFVEREPEEWLQEMVHYYRSWIKRGDRDFHDLTPEEIRVYRNSLFTIKSQINRKGAVVASPDADTFLVARDHYMYLWPRDGAMVAHALDIAGYSEEARRIYSFCSQIIEPEGYFLQRYNTDGTPGCTWHPMILDGRPIPPIQEDETALVIWALGQHYAMNQDLDIVNETYCSMVRPALNFMCDYIESQTGLPKPSWDLWEERRGIFSFTSGAICGALQSGITLATAAGDDEQAKKCRIGLNLLKESILKHLYHEGMNRFLRGVYLDDNLNVINDFTLDASLFGLTAFGAFPANDERIERTMTAVGTGLWVKTNIGGVTRYTGDYYHRVSDDFEQVPGNPWIITTLWLADWHIARGNQSDMERARRLIAWAAGQATSGRLLPEQVHPFTGEPMSVCPLTWSHSTLVKVISDYLNKKASIAAH
ncbi:MAG: glycoside hydrolase family 15 protein [Candidatus Saccharibacteria bacterium]